MITVFYDGACGLCSREIRYYKRIAPEDAFRWVDVSQETHQALTDRSISRADALRELHAEDQDGVVHRGVGAFLVIWKQLKYWRWLAYIVGAPLIRQSSGALYPAFARWRFNRLDHCQLAAREAQAENGERFKA